MSLDQLYIQHKQEMGQKLISLGKDFRKISKISNASRELPQVGDALAHGIMDYPTAHVAVERLYNEIHTFFGNISNASPQVRVLLDKLYRLERELSTPRNNVSNLYKTGSIGHGVMSAIKHRDGCTSKELKAYFSSLNDSSTLTHMRREGVIVKNGGVNTAWQLTPLGEEFLTLRGAYTDDMYGSHIGYGDQRPPVQCPWTLSSAAHADFVVTATRSRSRYGCN